MTVYLWPLTMALLTAWGTYDSAMSDDVHTIAADIARGESETWLPNTTSTDRVFEYHDAVARLTRRATTRSGYMFMWRTP